MQPPPNNPDFLNNTLTELTLHKGGIAATAISLTLILRALHDPNLVWYSTLYGDIEDNLAALAITSSDPHPDYHEPHQHNAPLKKWADPHLPITEYNLTPTVAALYNITFHQHKDAFGQPYQELTIDPEQLPPTVRYYFYAHDEYFTWLYPATQPTAHLYITHILEAYGRTFDKPTKWSFTADQLTALLYRWNAIRLKSNQNPTTPSLTLSLPNRAWIRNIWPGLKFRQAGRITFPDGIATLHLKHP